MQNSVSSVSSCDANGNRDVTIDAKNDDSRDAKSDQKCDANRDEKREPNRDANSISAKLQHFTFRTASPQSIEQVY